VDLTVTAPAKPDQGGRAVFLGLDGLRGLAALVVVMFHTRFMFGWSPDSGYLAVDLFFMLSGFVLAHAYDPRFAAGMAAAEFMRIRLIRLYPLYILGMALMVLSLLLNLALRLSVDWTPGKIAASFAFAIGFLPTPDGWGNVDALYPLNPPAWSLAFELLINAVFVLVWRHLSLRVLVAAAVVSGLVLIAVTGHYGSLNTGANWLTWAGGLPRIVYGFTVGVILLRLMRDRGLRLPVGAALPVVAMLALLAAAPPPSWRVASDLAISLVGFPLIVLASASVEPRRFAGTFAFLGLTSYAVYTLHIPLMSLTASVVLLVTGRRLEALAPWVGIAFIVVLLAAAWAADRQFDHPVRRWAMRVTGRGTGRRR
jgi:peptidoglycan/LPS O-acetylase OafA/YrhL